MLYFVVVVVVVVLVLVVVLFVFADFFFRKLSLFGAINISVVSPNSIITRLSRLLYVPITQSLNRKTEKSVGPSLA